LADAVNQSPDEAYARRVGETIKGKWRIDALLGVGGMAAVYAATHRNGSRSALKILHLDFARDKSICDRFLREAYVSNTINHPACVVVQDDDVTEEGEPYLVMELLEGETVRDLWRRTGRRVPVEQVLRIVDPILDCLAACHAIDVIHRDLKPANIFITRAGEVKVLDFGVAQMRSATAERTASGTALGTPHYMSPEQAMGLVDQLDGRADLFSVGALVHALVTGHRINSGRTENEALILAATTPVPSVARLAPELPVEVVALIDRALAWDRRNRFADAREMQAAVRAILGATPAPRPPESFPAKPRSSAAAPETLPATGAPTASPEGRVRAAAQRELFRHVDRLLPNVRQLGWDHPATDRALRTLFEALVDALQRDAEAFAFVVEPHSFSCAGELVWEPAPPFDALPYNLYSAGVRDMRFTRGLGLDELRDALELLLVDPARDLPPEDDLAAALWERAFAHLELGVADMFAEGDAAAREAFWDESDALEKIASVSASNARANQLEARAMAVSTDRGALGGERRVPSVLLDAAVRTALAAQLELPREAWSGRYVDALVEGYLDAAMARDAQLMLASLRKSSADLAVAGRLDVSCGLQRAICERLAQRTPPEVAQRLISALTSAMFGADALELSLRSLEQKPEDVALLAPILDALGPRELPAVLRALKLKVPEPVRAALLRCVERMVPGHEAEVAAAVESGLETALACALLRVLFRAGTPVSREKVGALAAADDMEVRLEARVLLAGSGEALQLELSGMLDHHDVFTRMGALAAMRRHGVTSAWGAVAKHVRAPGFHELGADEQREFLGAAIALQADRGEQLLLEVVKKGGVFSGGRDGTRALAAEVLGEHSRSAETASVLRELGQARWGANEEARDSAQRAAVRIEARAKESRRPQEGRARA